MLLKIMSAILIALAVMPILTGCEASFKDGDDKNHSSKGFTAHCSKYLKVKKPQGQSIKNAEESDKGAATGTDEKILYLAYSISQTEDGSTSVQCWISDGGREYKSDAYFKNASTHNYCDIVYDLDHPSFGTFTFEYSENWAWVNYYDEDSGYTFDRKFRSSECIQF